MPGHAGDRARVERPAEGSDVVVGSDAADAASAADPAARQIVVLALELRGRPYRNGGADPDGFDCSGFTQYVFAHAGRSLPRETRQQFGVGEPVPLGDQQPGDLIFFTTVAPGASHVAISLGRNAFVHAPSSRGVVRVESLDVSYWSRRLVGIRRVTEE
jgi:cell wall-associated NlpC family hydrolase